MKNGESGSRRPTGEKRSLTIDLRDKSLEGDSAQVLIVEDDVDTLEFFKMLFSSAGHSVWGACTSGETAISLCESADVLPDVVLMDYRLPGIDGIQVAERLLAMDSSIEIVFCSADDSARKFAEALGVRRFKKKPVENANLLRNVDQAYKDKLRGS